MNFDENQKFSMGSSLPMTLNKMAASMPKYEIWAHVEMVPYCITAHRSRSSQVDMLCTIDRYRLCELYARDVTARDSFTAQSGGLRICVSNSSDRAVRHARVTTRPVADGRQVDWCRNWILVSFLNASFVSFLVQSCTTIKFPWLEN